MECLHAYAPSCDRPTRRLTPRPTARNLAFIGLELLTAACVGKNATTPTPTPAPAEDVVAAVSCATGREVVSVSYNGNRVNCVDLIDFVPSRADFERVSQSGDVCAGRTTIGGKMSFEEWIPRSSDPNDPTTVTVIMNDGTLVNFVCGERPNGDWFQSVEPISPENQ